MSCAVTALERENEGTMPLVTIRVTGGNEAPTPEQKKELIRGATDLLVRVLGKNPATTTVIIDEVPPENWGIGGLDTPERRRREKTVAA